MLDNYNDLKEMSDIIENEDLVVALFSDLACNVCLSITPDLVDMSEKYPLVKFVSADVEIVKSFVGKYLIFAYPTIIVFAKGKETNRFERLFSLEDIENTVARYNELING